MDMSWSVWMLVHELEQFPSGTVKRYGVWRWSKAVKRILAALVGDELAAQVVDVLIFILLLVETWIYVNLDVSPKEPSFDIPFVDACQTSISAFAKGLPVLLSTTLPYMYTTSAPSALVRYIEAPFLSLGLSPCQKGPKMALCVAVSAASEAFL